MCCDVNSRRKWELQYHTRVANVMYFRSCTVPYGTNVTYIRSCTIHRGTSPHAWLGACHAGRRGAAGRARARAAGARRRQASEKLTSCSSLRTTQKHWNEGETRASFGRYVEASTDVCSWCLLDQNVHTTVLSEQLAVRPRAGRPAGWRGSCSERTVLWTRWAGRHHEHTSALASTCLPKDARVSPSFQCFCVVRKLLQLVSSQRRACLGRPVD